jgi:hypothetical protein
MKSQTLLSYVGGVMKNNQVSVNFSLGENCIQIFNTQHATIAQGFEQCVVSTVTAVKKPLNSDLLFNYQSTGYINYYHVPLEEKYQYSLVSMSGQEMLNGSLNGEPINATSIHSGVYQIRVSSKKKEIGIYKILIH